MIRLPRMVTPPDSPDGKLPDHLSYPIRVDQSSAITWYQTGHSWNGPKDLSMKVRTGWNDSGIMLQIQVCDDEVINHAIPAEYWKQDCVELYFGAREPGYAFEPIQLLVRPPVDGNVDIYCAIDGVADQIKAQGSLTPDGYALEVLVPFAVLGNLPSKAGGAVAMQFAVDDYDSRDGELVCPLQMSWMGESFLYRSSEKYPTWRLADQEEPGTVFSLKPFITIGLDALLLDDRLACTVTLDDALINDTAGITIDIMAAGELVERTEYTPSQLERLDDARLRLQTQWQVPGLPDGDLEVILRCRDEKNQELGFMSQKIFHWKLKERFDAMKWEELIAEKPFWVQGATALFSGIEFIKAAARHPVLRDKAIREVQCRLALLENRPLPEPDNSLRLLELTRNFATQLSVEFHRHEFHATFPKRGSLSLACGNLPLVNADFYDFASEEDAQKELLDRLAIWHDRKEISIPGADYAAVASGYQTEGCLEPDLNPEKFLTIWTSRQPGNAFYLPFEGAAKLNWDAIVLLDGAPEAAVAFAKEKARENGIPTITLEELPRYSLVAIAGTAPHGTFQKWFIVSSFFRENRQLLVRKGSMLFYSGFDAPDLSIRFLEAILSGKPFTAELAEELRQLRVKYLAPTIAPACRTLPGKALWSGDVHTHTIYSDGGTTPAGNVLEAIYANLDFLVISDHNTVEGALINAEKAQDTSFHYPVVVGMEVTTEQFHINLFPLKRNLIQDILRKQTKSAEAAVGLVCNVSPAELIPAARSAGCVIQWNHPGSYGRELEGLLEHGLRDAGIDAWERCLMHYEEFRARNILNPITGSTDTHGGIFGHYDLTVIPGEEFSEELLVSRIREGQCAMINPKLPDYVYGPEELRGAVLTALQQPVRQRKQMQERLKQIFESADVIDYIIQSPGREGIKLKML